MSIFSFLLTLSCTIVVGSVCYYIGYMSGTEKEHDRLCEQWMKENREDNR